MFLFVGSALGAAAAGALVALATVFSPTGVWSTRDLAITGGAGVLGLGIVAYKAADMKRRGLRLLDAMRRNAVPLALLVLMALWLLVYLSTDIFVAIQPGQGGVLWKRFGGGTVTERVYGEGLHMIPPWDNMTVYDLRYQQQSGEFEVLSSDGLLYTVEVTVRFRLRPQSLGLLHKCVGPRFVDTMLLPEVGAVTRLVTAQLRPEELYTTQRQASEADIRKRLRLQVSSCASRSQPMDVADLSDAPEGATVDASAGERYFEASEVFIRRVVLPPKVAEAIEAKLVQHQKMLEYEYRIDRERKEAQRKTIEAEGIRTYNELVARGMSPSVLQWHGVEATLELAKSPNSKVVVIGSTDKAGLPLILGTLQSQEATAAPTAGGSAKARPPQSAASQPEATASGVRTAASPPAPAR